MKRFTVVVFAGLAAFIALAAMGCDILPFGKKEASQQATAPAAVPAVPTVPTAVPAPAAVPAAPAVPAVTVPQYAWTETPTLETIPQVAAAGMANGKPMGVAAVVFEPGMTGWKLVLSDTALDSPTGLITTGQSINIDLPEAPTAGKSYTRKMEYGGGFFQINNDPANAAATTSWNADNAWVLEVTTWDVKPWDATPNAPLFQDAGKASGKISVCYKGDAAGIQSSWVAGTFTDATVRYMGKPAWLEEKAAATESAKTETSKSGSSSGSSDKATTGKKAEDKKVEEANPDPTPKPDPAPETGKTGDATKTKVDTGAIKKSVLEGINKLKVKKPAQQ